MLRSRSEPPPTARTSGLPACQCQMHTQQYRPPLVILPSILPRVKPGSMVYPCLEKIPQPPYDCGKTQNNWEKSSPVLFSKWGYPGVRLLDAFRGKFEGIDDRDSFPLGANFSGISIRIHLPGYPSSTYVGEHLKWLASRGGKDKVNSRARSMQVSTKNYKAKAEPVAKSKLAQEVAKRVLWHIEDLMNNSDLFPFDDRVEGKWRLGEGFMRFENMTITALEHVTKGSWSPVIHIDKVL
ncbi:hypothetical protein BJ322DRAFT_1107618 [Thelephora terrestris]|uniref:Uncharacterized protein n=1 Tax=Thelephora terrestris TaxID=56493 RepID=A0A9P6L780_9AGAM|nr:hypothetical protein BJ322DRAFT_1107618 [Thelephora terrestris]